MKLASHKTTKICVFFKHWYDPANSHLAVQTASIGMWKYDDKAKELCMKNNLTKPSWASCGSFECKFG